jgi:uncharacterized protein YkwD
VEGPLRPQLSSRISPPEPFGVGYPKPRSENIAAGQPTPAAVMDSWMHSPGHKANILDCTATQMGLAAANGGDFGTYWTQDFGTA